MYLNCHSYYSLRYGTLTLEQLVEMAVRCGVRRMALTDINNCTGTFDFVRACVKNGIEPVAGMEIRQGNDFRYVLLARNNEGFREMNEFVSHHNIQSLPFPTKAPVFQHVFVVYDFDREEYYSLRENEYMGIGYADTKKLFIKRLQSKKKLVIRHPVTYATADQYKLHKHLRAVDNNILLSRLTEDLVASGYERMVPIEKFKELYKDFDEAIRNTEEILEQCTFVFDFESVKNKKIFTASRKDDRELLEKLTMDGIPYRYGKKNKEALKRAKYELEVIDKLGFSSYFLITWDIIRYGMSRGYYHVGRGSGANSIVAYCLKITDVDPIELDLYFERFLNSKRTSPPDFDIDFSWKERDDIYNYIFKRYGSQHTALLGAMSTFKGNSVIREFSKTYGLPKSEIDRIADLPLDSKVKGEIPELIFKYGKMIQDFPNQRTIHACGVLISEEPICYYSALDLPPKNLPTVQWDMYISEDIGFEKFDILSQRGIGHIKDTAEIVRRNRKIKIDVHDVESFKKDPQVKAQLKSGDSIGCFYIESPAMRGLLKKLRCDDFITLVAASSIIRPGVSSSGMMQQYIQRFHKPDSFEYLHPVMKEQLQETYGVMVYQEDVLKICHHYAGLDLADADLLRRAMSGKFRSRKAFDLLIEKFFESAKAMGRDEKITAEIWRQISSFGGYSFCKAHSASFAVESFQSLYLKAHFPAEFHTAVINNFGGFYTTWVYIKEAVKWGANIHLPCVNRSEFLTTIYDKDIFLGFVHIQNLEQTYGKSIEEERIDNGEYKSLSEFVKRTKIPREQLFILIRIGALRSLGSKKKLLWEATLFVDSKARVEIKQGVDDLFENKPKEFELPELEEDAVEDAYDEIEFLGFPLSVSEFELLKTKYRGNCKARDLNSSVGKVVRILGNYVTTKPIRTKNGKAMAFGTFLDEELQFFDTTHFEKVLAAYPFTGRGVYLIEGLVVEEFGVCSIEVHKMAKLPWVEDPRG
jgi:error-prone DNA polymerase